MPGTLGTGLDTPYQYDIYVGMWHQARSSRKKKEMTTTRWSDPMEEIEVAKMEGLKKVTGKLKGGATSDNSSSWQKRGGTDEKKEKEGETVAQLAGAEWDGHTCSRG
uniref:Uncharacterized protein n=1 Tax=Oryza nivara TaxID=4536 RepID=A0A0E0ILV0_ORYNI